MPVYKGVTRRVGFDMVTTAGAEDTASSPAVQVSQDGGAFVAATNAPARIGATGSWTVLLTAAEMTGDLVTVRATASGDVPRIINVYTEADFTSGRAVNLDNLSGSVETGETVVQTLRLLRAVLSGAAAVNGQTVAFKRKDGTTVAFTITADSVGNRTSPTVGTL